MDHSRAIFIDNIVSGSLELFIVGNTISLEQVRKGCEAFRQIREAVGDRIEIMTGKTGAPKRDWLLAANGYLASSRSRDKVRSYFFRLDPEQLFRNCADSALQRQL